MILTSNNNYENKKYIVYICNIALFYDYKNSKDNLKSSVRFFTNDKIFKKWKWFNEMQRNWYSLV